MPCAGLTLIAGSPACAVGEGNLQRLVGGADHLLDVGIDRAPRLDQQGLSLATCRDQRWTLGRRAPSPRSPSVPALGPTSGHAPRLQQSPTPLASELPDQPAAAAELDPPSAHRRQHRAAHPRRGRPAAAAAVRPADHPHRQAHRRRCHPRRARRLPATGQPAHPRANLSGLLLELVGESKHQHRQQPAQQLAVPQRPRRSAADPRKRSKPSDCRPSPHAPPRSANSSYKPLYPSSPPPSATTTRPHSSTALPPAEPGAATPPPQRIYESNLTLKMLSEMRYPDGDTVRPGRFSCRGHIPSQGHEGPVGAAQHDVPRPVRPRLQ